MAIKDEDWCVDGATTFGVEMVVRIWTRGRNAPPDPCVSTPGFEAQSRWDWGEVEEVLSSPCGHGIWHGGKEGEGEAGTQKSLHRS